MQVGLGIEAEWGAFFCQLSLHQFVCGCYLCCCYSALCDKLSQCHTRVDSGWMCYFLIIQEQVAENLLHEILLLCTFLCENKYSITSHICQNCLSLAFWAVLTSSRQQFVPAVEINSCRPKRAWQCVSRYILWHLHERIVKYHYSVKTVKLAVTVIKFALGAYLMFMLVVNCSLENNWNWNNFSLFWSLDIVSLISE